MRALWFYLLYVAAIKWYLFATTGADEDHFEVEANLLDERNTDPSDFLAEVHAPTPNVSYIHQLSRSFLSLTKDLLRLAPRTGEQSVATSLYDLQRLRPDDVSAVLKDQGIIIPPSHGIICGRATDAYRTMDGSCNNLMNPCWGKAEEPYQRWLPPDYANGIDEPRVRKDGSALPSPRVVYQIVSSEYNASAQTQIPYITNLLVSWGQFVSHDVVFTPTARIKVWNGREIVEKKVRCCNSTSHPDCFPLYIIHRDVYYPPGHCMNFVRSSAYAHRVSSCYSPTLGQRREQINQLTAYIDGSVVYGSSEEDMRKLREHGGYSARLMMSEHFGHGYLPRRNGSCKATTSDVCDKRCFLSGEKRGNENPVLIAFHTLLVRHHNRLVDGLRNRGWNEETLFHVVRKIVGAQLQHVTYNEFLRLFLGQRLNALLQLEVPTEGGYVYDDHINPTIYNVFATAAYRCGHSMISARQKRRGKRILGSPSLSHDFFSMDDFCDTNGDALARLLGGQAEQAAQKVDPVFTKEVTNHLFAKEAEGPGLDLYSLNIQRGRDHGLPSYNQWRMACGLRKADDYSDLSGEIPHDVIGRLHSVYGAGKVDDIDLYIGALSELPVNDGILGPTFTCIIANQFRNLKFGDRFWYENKNTPGAFTEDQLREIQKTTIASLICENSDVGEIQAAAFMVEGPHNPKWPCDVILHRHRLNLSAWP